MSKDNSSQDFGKVAKNLLASGAIKQRTIENQFPGAARSEKYPYNGIGFCANGDCDECLGHVPDTRESSLCDECIKGLN